MKRNLLTTLLIVAGALPSGALASEAATSASVSRNNRTNTNVATATAEQHGAIGFSRTKARTGRINIARGVAVGFDANGLSLSVSNAVGTKYGPALATNFNMSVGLDGEVTHSSGVALADGRVRAGANAGGRASATRFNDTATAFATADSDRRGFAKSKTRADNYQVATRRFARPSDRLAYVARRTASPSRRIHTVRRHTHRR